MEFAWGSLECIIEVIELMSSSKFDFELKLKFVPYQQEFNKQLCPNWNFDKGAFWI